MSKSWGEITAADLLTCLDGELVRGSGSRRFRGFSSDSRNIREDFLFWALEGEKYDGHDFLPEAILKGAAGAVIRKGFELVLPTGRDAAVIAVPDTLRALGDLSSWWRHEHEAVVVAITGSAGKTTTKEMAAAILSRRGETLKNPGNFNNLIGLPVTLLCLEDKHRYAVLEMGMNRPGEIGRLTEIADPDLGLITNVGRAHLEGVGTLEGVAKAKVELIENMSDHATALLNGDDPVLMQAASSFSKKMHFFGVGRKNEVRAENIRELGLQGSSFDIRHGGGIFTVNLKVPGLQHVQNALAAAAASLQLGASPEEVVEGLSAFKSLKGRFAIINLPNGVILVDDTYNCNPLSLKYALDSLRTWARKRKVIVGLGEMLELGDETLRAHLEAGAMVAGLGAGLFVALGEHADVMIQGALDKGFPENMAVKAGDHEEMEQRIRAEMREGDVVFLKGSRGAGLDKVVERLTAGANAL
jgi:UDP-N-acetylmuramoyl-tripeptide--D-alanyl-D-alanine ligase